MIAIKVRKNSAAGIVIDMAGSTPEVLASFRSELSGHGITCGWNPDKRQWILCRVGGVPNGPTYVLLRLRLGHEAMASALLDGPDKMAAEFDCRERQCTE